MAKQNPTSINSETVGKEYEQDLQKRINDGIKVPEHNLKFFKGLALSISAGILMLTGVNCAFHNGLQKYNDPRILKGTAKTTGIISYVEYRKVWSETGDFNVIIDGDILTGIKKWYADTNDDKKVDVIGYDSNQILYREYRYKEYKTEFDKADKYFAKYFEELSK